MIAVDTSVWVAALRSASSAEARVLHALLEADEVALPVPVRTELVGGAREADRPALKRALSALPLLYPTDDTWGLIDGWVERAAAAGQHFGFGDLLIGALASESGGLVWSLDGDFVRLARMGVLECYEP